MYNLIAGSQTLALSFEISSAASTICNLIVGIANPTAVVCLGLALTRIVLSRSPKTAEDAMSWAKGVIVTFVIFNILGSFLSWVDTNIATSTPSQTYNSKNLSATIDDEGFKQTSKDYSSVEYDQNEAAKRRQTN